MPLELFLQIVGSPVKLDSGHSLFDSPKFTRPEMQSVLNPSSADDDDVAMEFVGDDNGGSEAWNWKREKQIRF